MTNDGLEQGALSCLSCCVLCPLEGAHVSLYIKLLSQLINYAGVFKSCTNDLVRMFPVGYSTTTTNIVTIRWFSAWRVVSVKMFFLLILFAIYD